MNARVEKLREITKSAIHANNRIVLPDNWSTADLSMSLQERRAMAIKLVAERMPLVYNPGELLVGSKTVYGPSINETRKDDPHYYSLKCFPHYATDEEKQNRVWHEGYASNHCLPAWRLPLEKGLDGMRAEIEVRRSRHGTTKAQNEFLNSAKIVLDAVTVLAERYEDYLFSLSTKDAIAEDELREISHICGKVAHLKPDTLHEALQLYLFVYYVLLIEEFCAVGFGRLDQLLLPFVKDESDERLEELLGCFMLKLNDISDVCNGDTDYNGNDSMVLCGVTRDGKDATNKLSYMFLRLFAELRMSTPVPCIRVASSTPDDIVELTCLLNFKGLNGAALYNDDMFVKALTNQGFPIEDARDWGIDLCQDLQIAGKSAFYVGGEIGTYYSVDKAIRESQDDITWEEFLERAKLHLAEDIRKTLSSVAVSEACAYDYPENNNAFMIAEENGLYEGLPRHTSFSYRHDMLSPCPALSVFLEGCVENARDMNNGGMTYRHKGAILMVPTTAVNALAAIHFCVFETKSLKLSQIVKALDNNYEGYEDVHQLLLNAPKWGNDDRRVDDIAKDYLEFGLREINRYSLREGQVFLAGVHQPHTQMAGKNYNATADGRKAKEPVAVTISPSNGTDINGPTAAMNSCAKLDPMLIQWNSALTLAFDGSGAVNAKVEKAKVLAQLTRGFFDKGGMQFQPNVLSADELIDAQKHPEMHRDLLVRVWGVSMFFVELGKDWQDEIIQRTLHRI